MGREIVYCWKCQTRLQGSDFDSAKAYRVGDQVSCPDCVEELVADLPAEEQEAILNPPKRSKSQSIKKISSTNLPSTERSEGTSRRTASIPKRSGATGPVPKARTGQTGPIPTAKGTRVTRKVTRPIPKVQPPEDEEGMEEGDEEAPKDDKKKKLILFGGIGAGVLVVIVIVMVIMMSGKPAKKPSETAGAGTEEGGKPKPAANSGESSKEKTVKALLKEGFDQKPDALGAQLKKFREAEKAAEGTKILEDVTAAIDGVLVKLDKAIAALDKQVESAYGSGEYKTVLDTYESAKASHDVSEWQDRIETKIKLVRNRIEDSFSRMQKEAQTAKEAGDDAKIKELKDQIAKWGMPDKVEKFDKFVATIAVSDPADPGKDPGSPAPRTGGKNRVLSPALKAFMPAWQKAMGPAQLRDYSAAATEMSGASKSAESDEAKKAAADDAAALEGISALYPELLKSAAQASRSVNYTLEYQDQPSVWKKVSGRVLKAEPTRLEFKPAAVNGKEQPALFIEISDLNAGSLAELHKAKKKPDGKEADLLTKLCLIEGATESAQAIGGNAPDRYWIFATEARALAPKPNSREFEARILFHQSEFEWRKSATKYAAIEKSKTLIGDYTSTAVVKKYQPQIAKRAETGKDFVFLPSDLATTGDYNVFKIAKKEDPAWVTTKQIDFKDSLFNYVEAEFIALPNLTYRCWVYAGGCCQEVWNGSYQASDATTNSKGKAVSIDPGVQMAASLPMPSGLKKLHDDHKPKPEKGAKEAPPHPKTPAKWDWISIPLPKTFPSPGAKQIRILTDQQGFGVKYVIISSTRQKAPDEATAKELAKDAAAAAASSGKSDVKGTPQPKDWLVIGPFAEALATEQGPEKDIDLSKELAGKSKPVKWTPASASMQGANALFDWEKGPFSPKDNVSGYAVIFVKSPSAMDAKIVVSHDDGCRIWYGRTLVHNQDRTIAKDKEVAEDLKLEEGWNRLLVKVRNGNAQFFFQMRITDAAKNPIPNLEYSPYGDALDPQ